MNLLAIPAGSPDQQACIEHLEKAGWADGPHCGGDHCGSDSGGSDSVARDLDLTPADILLQGIVEADEACVDGKPHKHNKYSNNKDLPPPPPPNDLRDRRWLRRLFSLNCLVPAILALSSVALPQQAAAQTSSTTYLGTTYKISDAPPVTEGGTAIFTVTVENGRFPFDAAIRYLEGSASWGDLAASRPRSTRIPLTNFTIEVPIEDDDIAEGTETFMVVLTIAIDSHLADIQATGTIKDNDSDDDNDGTVGTTVSITAKENANAKEGGTARFTVSLSRTLGVDVVLTVAYAGGTNNPATPADDLGSDRPTTVTINRGTTEATLVVPINEDTIVEGDETFTVTVNTAHNGVTIGSGVATGTIEDNDTARVRLAPRTQTVAENETFNYTVSLSNPADEAVTVRWTASAEPEDTASVTDDLQATTNTVTFNANDNTDQTFTIAVNDDNLDEEEETFTVTLEVDTQGNNPLPTGVTIGTSNRSTATITDNDDTPVANATISIGDESVVENVAAGSVTFTVELTTKVASDVVLAVAVTAGTATLGDDLGISLQDTVTIRATTTETTFTVPITNDPLVEGNETFTVTLSPDSTTPLPEGVTIRDGTATGTIEDNDMARVRLAPGTQTAAENETFNYTVTLSAPVSRAVNITWTAAAESGDTATVMDDLDAPLTGTLTFQANNNEDQTFSIAVNDDDTEEDNETFTVTIRPTGSLPDRVEIGQNRTSSMATITDNDEPQDDATVTISNGDELENVTGGIMPFTVTLSAAVSRDVVLDVTYTAGENIADPRPSATLADDLGDLPDTITITEGNTEATLMVPVINDSLVEDVLEVFTVTLGEDEDSPLPEGVTILDGVAIGVIEDNDLASVTLSPATLTAAENESFEYTVSLSAASSKDVNIAWAATAESGDTATVADDLDAPRTGTVRFLANNNTAQTFSIAATDDDTEEDNETFTVTISPTPTDLPSGVEIDPENNSSAATITDNDEVAAVTIRDQSADEGDSVVFTVSLDTAASGDLVLDVTYAPGTENAATLVDDLGTLPPTVTIADGQISGTLTVPITEDAIVEGDETFTVTINDSVATGTIEDDDTALVTLSPARLTAAENGAFSYTVSLSAAADEAVNITWTASAETGDTATVGDDLQAITNSLSFAANDNEDKTFTIQPFDDTTVEPNETFTVTLTATDTLPTGVDIDTNSNRSVATITDNDEASMVAVNIDDASATEEGAGGSIAFTVRLAQAVDENVVLAVAYAPGTDDPATLADDLGTLPPTVTINQGATRATITVPIIDDDIVEENETFTVTISEDPANRLPADVIISNDVATGTITSGDTARVRVDGGTVLEDQGDLFMPVSLSARVSSDVVLDVTYAAGSTNPVTLVDDLGKPLQTTVMIAAGTRQNPIRVPIIDDNLVEDDETFTVTISESRASPLPNRVTISPGQDGVTVTIIDNDVEEEEGDVSRVLPILVDLLLDY